MVGLDVALELSIGSFQLDAAFTASGGITVLFGPSGAGKTQTLRCIAGLARPDVGRIVVGQRVLFDSSAKIDVPTRERRIGYVFQQYALFPHLTVGGNIAYGLPHQESRRRTARVAEMLELVGLRGYEHRHPRELSGGEQQRVALARALAPAPDLLLLDEPFSALDSAIRETLREELRQLQRQLQVGIVFVTHDPADTAVLADTIAVYEQGRVLQAGPRDEVFRRPASAAVARLTGAKNILSGVVVESSPSGLRVDLGNAQLWASAMSGAVGDVVAIVVRSEDARLLGDDASDDDQEIIAGVVRSAVSRGQHYLVQVEIGSDEQSVEVSVPVWWWERHELPVGAPTRIAIARRSLHVLPDAASQQRAGG